MKLFFTRAEKKEIKTLKQLEKSNTRKMTKEEYHKIEEAEKLIDNRRSIFFSTCVLFISFFNFIFVIISRL